MTNITFPTLDPIYIIIIILIEVAVKNIVSHFLPYGPDSKYFLFRLSRVLNVPLLLWLSYKRI